MAWIIFDIQKLNVFGAFLSGDYDEFAVDSEGDLTWC